MKWIPVSERLPKDHDVVIVQGGIAYIRKGEWMTLTGERYPGLPIQWTVTHWMPLPEAPDGR
jgi:glutamine cyclotransferase